LALLRVRGAALYAASRAGRAVALWRAALAAGPTMTTTAARPLNSAAAPWRIQWLGGGGLCGTGHIFLFSVSVCRHMLAWTARGPLPLPHKRPLAHTIHTVPCPCVAADWQSGIRCTGDQRQKPAGGASFGGLGARAGRGAPGWARNRSGVGPGRAVWGINVTPQSPLGWSRGARTSDPIHRLKGIRTSID